MDNTNRDNYYNCNIRIIRTYFKSEEAPLCRFKRIKKTTNRGDGISPNLTKNLDKVRRVGTLFAVQFKCRVEK